jgi:8-oxo-dGTP pyrophosphatase MutT (NUDIX family)
MDPPGQQGLTMSGLRNFLRFVLTIVVVGVLVNLSSQYLAERFPFIWRLTVQLAIIGLCVWGVFLAAQFAVAFLTSGKYAVEALILNHRDELMVYFHTYHKVMLPPGGRVKRSEFPNTALQRRLRERTGLQPHQYGFDERFHHGLDGNSGNLDRVQRVAAPFLVQQEMRRQRAFVRFHFDFIYVLKLKENSPTFDEAKYGPVHFVGLSALREMVAQGRTFPDVLDAYERLLEISARSGR